MMPEGSSSGSLRLYRAVNYPLHWELEAEIMNRPLVDASIVEWKGRWFLFASDPSRPGHRKNAEFQIFHAETPLGPWSRHFLNPAMTGHPGAGARMAGRIIQYDGHLYRFGQDCSGTYGNDILAFRIDALSPQIFEQTQVEFVAGRAKQGMRAWNGVRRHHLDAMQLSDGGWLAVMDGDWQESNPLTRSLVRRATVLGLVWATAAVIFILTLADKKYGQSHSRLVSSTNGLPSQAFLRRLGKLDSGAGGSYRKLISLPGQHAKWLLQRGRGLDLFFRELFQLPFSKGTLLPGMVALGLLATVIFASQRAKYYLDLVREVPTATSAIALDGSYSRFTAVILSYGPRSNTLRAVVDHYARCPSVAEVLVVWNGGVPPSDVTTATPTSVPVRVRVEDHTSLNNRFKPDPLLKTRAILSLDDDILLRCGDVEAAFAEWRQHPEALVGFQPRLLQSGPAVHLEEEETLAAGKFNALLTGAAFLDADKAFGLYWGAWNAKARDVVDRRFSCEDILMNFVVASAPANRGEAAEAPLRLVRPKIRLDVSAAGPGRKAKQGASRVVREGCIDELAELFGGFPLVRTVSTKTAV